MSKNFGPSARDLAVNHWPEILVAAGVSDEHLCDVHTICPICGSNGKAHFRYDDQDGRGTYICNDCGAGDGFRFLMQYMGTSSFVEAARFVEGYFQGVAVPVTAPIRVAVKSAPKDDPAKIAKKLQKAWSEAVVVKKNDPVWRYLVSTRKLPLTEIPGCIRLHPAMDYFDKVKGVDGRWTFKKTATYPAMLTKVADPTGKPVGLHRTYLTPEGLKAPVGEVKKLMKSLGMHGGAIRLKPVGTVMGLAEGIESAIAAHALTSLPTWATVSSTIMMGFEPPAGVRTIVVFADNDKEDAYGRRAGLDAAMALKARLEPRGIEVILAMPVKVGTDIHNVWISALSGSTCEAISVAVGVVKYDGDPYSDLPIRSVASILRSKIKAKNIPVAIKRMEATQVVEAKPKDAKGVTEVEKAA